MSSSSIVDSKSNNNKINGTSSNNPLGFCYHDTATPITIRNNDGSNDGGSYSNNKINSTSNNNPESSASKDNNNNTRAAATRAANSTTTSTVDHIIDLDNESSALKDNNNNTGWVLAPSKRSRSNKENRNQEQSNDHLGKLLSVVE